MAAERKVLTILVAEDEAISRRLLEASLTNWGYSVRVAENGKQACTILQQGGIDICLLDWEMPRKTGLAVCSFIRSNKTINPEQYVILLTAKNTPEQIAQGYGAGANEYITKPFDRAALRKLLMDFGSGAVGGDKANTGIQSKLR